MHGHGSLAMARRHFFRSLTMQLVLNTVDDAMLLLKRGAAYHFNRVEIAPDMQSARQVQIEPMVRSINRHLRPCGCGVAAVLVCLSLTGMGLAWVRGMAWPFGWSFSAEIALSIGLVFCAAGLGKAAGVAFSLYRLRQQTMALVHILSQPVPGGHTVTISDLRSAQHCHH